MDRGRRAARRDHGDRGDRAVCECQRSRDSPPWHRMPSLPPRAADRGQTSSRPGRLVRRSCGRVGSGSLAGRVRARPSSPYNRGTERARFSSRSPPTRVDAPPRRARPAHERGSASLRRRGVAARLDSFARLLVPVPAVPRKRGDLLGERQSGDSRSSRDPAGARRSPSRDTASQILRVALNSRWPTTRPTLSARLS
jgi:hypothetical protein